jgi:outer membrane protein OmpA-like peptidoglycan-associated protein
MKAFFFLFISFFAASNMIAQNYVSFGDAPKKASKAYDEAIEFLREKELVKAEEALQKAVKVAPNFIDAHWQLGELYFQQKKYPEAETAYKRSVQLSQSYKPQTLFTLGLIQERQKNWAKAADQFDEFLKLRRDPELIKKATRQAAYCRFRAVAYANPVPFEPKNLGKSINTINDEYLPSLSIDAKTLIFTANVDNNKNEEFYTSTWQDGVWQPCKSMGAPLNTKNNEGAQTIAANGKTLVFSACGRVDGLGSCDFYISDFVNGEWTKPRNMGYPINTKKWEGHASLSGDGRTLYFSSNRKTEGEDDEKEDKNDKGNDDIFVAKRNDDGSWNEPVPLSPIINTPYGERSPFIHPDGQTLYFSSSGHAGIGKSDMFCSKKQENGEWSTPINLGYPINTTGADWSLIVAPDGKMAIYSAERDDSRGGKDLYQFELPENVRATPTTFVRGIVQDSRTQQPIANAKCDLIDLGTQAKIASVQTSANGSFLVPLPTGKTYGMTIGGLPGYTFFSDNFELKGISSADKPFEKQIVLQKIVVDPLPEPVSIAPTDPVANTLKTTPVPTNIVPEPNKPIILRNIFFKTGSNEILPESKYEMELLFSMLKENPSLRIQIGGHTDNQGSAATNQALSERRAAAVVAFLVQNNIDKSRLSARGFGETMPIESNDTNEGRAKNRRTEFLIK